MPDTDTLIKLLVFLGILLGVWVLFNVIFRMAKRVFYFGCGSILVMGIILVVLDFLGR